MEERNRIIQQLRIAFKGQKFRISGGAQMWQLGQGFSKNKKKTADELFKGPFDECKPLGDDWKTFLHHIFSTLESQYLKRIDFLHMIQKERSFHSPSPETCGQEKALVSEYFDKVESLVYSWVRFMESMDPTRPGYVFLEYKDAIDALNKLYENTVLRNIGINSGLPIFFLEYIVTHIICEKNRKASESETQCQKLSQEISRIKAQIKADKTQDAQSLRLAIQNKVHHTTNTPPIDIKSNVETRKENDHLKFILQQLWYDPDQGIDPKVWLGQNIDDAAKNQESQWEGVAMEESENNKRLQKEILKQEAYIAYLENRLTNTSGNLQEQYQKEQWNSWTMDLNDMMVYVSQNPEVGEIILPHVIRFIDCCVSKIGGSTLSSTNNSGVWIGSGHICNIVLKPLLHFIQDRIKNGEFEYFTLSWKGVLMKYMRSAWWEKSQGSSPTFNLLLKNLSDEPGNITNIWNLLDWMRDIEKELHADYKKLCEIISDLFQEKMNVLHRQILAEKIS